MSENGDASAPVPVVDRDLHPYFFVRQTALGEIIGSSQIGQLRGNGGLTSCGSKFILAEK